MAPPFVMSGAKLEAVAPSPPPKFVFAKLFTNETRHRASTSMYSLTFCVRFLLPERHQWKPAVQTAEVMLRTPPSAAGRPRPLPVCGARFWGSPPVARRSPAGGARRPRPAGRSH